MQTPCPSGLWFWTFHQQPSSLLGGPAAGILTVFPSGDTASDCSLSVHRQQRSASSWNLLSTADLSLKQMHGLSGRRVFCTTQTKKTMTALSPGKQGVTITKQGIPKAWDIPHALSGSRQGFELLATDYLSYRNGSIFHQIYVSIHIFYLLWDSPLAKTLLLKLQPIRSIPFCKLLMVYTAISRKI